MLGTKDFEIEIKAQIRDAFEKGRPWVEIKAGDVHRKLGGYPGKNGNHRMKCCCGAMRNIAKNRKTEILYSPPSGDGASLKHRYYA